MGGKFVRRLGLELGLNATTPIRGNAVTKLCVLSFLSALALLVAAPSDVVFPQVGPVQIFSDGFENEVTAFANWSSHTP